MPSMSGKRHDTIGVHSANPGMGLTVIGHLDGLELHLKEALKYQPERRFRRENEHLDAAAGVDGIEAFYAQCVANGATITKPRRPKCSPLTGAHWRSCLCLLPLA